MEDKIKKIMSSVFGLHTNKIKNNSSPDNIKSWDSIQHMNLILALEEEFNIKFTDDESVEMLNYSLIKKILYSKLK